jgi:hypothetical protein
MLDLCGNLLINTLMNSVVRPKSWTPGIINKPKLRKGCPDAKAPQVYT